MKTKGVTRRRLLHGMVVASAGVFLAACAPATPEPTKAPTAEQGAQPATQPAKTQPATQPTTQPAVQPAEPSLEGKTFVLWGLQYDPHVERYNMLAEAFFKETGASATVEPQPWPLETKVLAGAAANVLPDVVCVMGKSSVPLFQQQVIVPIDEAVFEHVGLDTDEFFSPGSIGAYFWDGKHYGVPIEDNCVGMAAAVRTDWLEEAGDAAKALWPAAQGKDGFESYEDMWALAELLQRKDASGNVTVWGLSSQGWDYPVVLGIMRELGQKWYDPEAQKFNMDSDECITALDLFIRIPVFERKIETQLDVSHMDALLSSKVALARGNNAIPGEAAKIGLPVESVLAPPAKAGGTLTLVGEGGWGFEVPTNAKSRDIGIEFLRFMCTYEAQYIYAGIYGGTMTSCIPVMSSDIYAGDDPVKRSIRRHLKSLGNTTYYGWGFGLPSAIEEIIGQVCGQVRTGELQPAEAAKELQARMEEHRQQWLEGKLPTPEE